MRNVERCLNDFDLQAVIALLHLQVDRLTLLTCIPAGKGERFSDSAARGLGYRLGSTIHLGQLLGSPILWETPGNTRSIQPDFERAHHHEST